MSTKDDEQGYYICGRCHSKQFYLKTSGPSDICDLCGYQGKTRSQTLLPSEIKLNLSNY